MNCKCTCVNEIILVLVFDTNNNSIKSKMYVLSKLLKAGVKSATAYPLMYVLHITSILIIISLYFNPQDLQIRILLLPMAPISILAMRIACITIS